MISKAKIKYIRSLEHKKNRKAEGLFVAEVPKVVNELLEVRSAKILVATSEWLTDERKTLISDETEIIEVTADELKKVSFLQHPQEVLGVFEIANNRETPSSLPLSKLSLALDGVQDPGNLGTIIRIADWFGIENVFCSKETADIYNPKVVQATMGSIARVRVTYTDLVALIDTIHDNIPVYGTMLDGDCIYTQQLTSNGLIVMGNEGNGISDDVARKINNRLLIPDYPIGHKTTDSLNVAVATSIVCSEFRRRKFG